MENSEGVKLNVKTHGIMEAVNSNISRGVRQDMLEGKAPKACRHCFDVEELGNDSPRLGFIKKYHLDIDPEKAKQITKDDGRIDQFPQYLDLRLGNTCNLRCVMCDPWNSNQWYKEWREIYGDPLIDKSVFRWSNEDSVGWREILNHLSSVKEIYFTGGEPTVIPAHLDLIKKLVDEGYSSQISLIYNSNLAAKISDQMLDLWSKFKLVTIGCSLDAVGPALEYIRYPSRWEVILKNLERIKGAGCKIWLAPTVQALNAPYLLELFDWALDSYFTLDDISLNILRRPAHLNLQVLPHSAKLELEEKYLSWLMIHPEFGTKLKPMIGYMMREPQNEIPLRTQLVNYCLSIDRMRDLRVNQALPELVRLLNKQRHTDLSL